MAIQHQQVANMIRAKISIDGGRLLRVVGPIKIHVDYGRVRVLGIDLETGREVLVSRYRSYALKVLEPSTISVVVGEGGGIEEPLPGEEPIDSWESLGREIVERGGRVVILGHVESCKTTFATLLSNLAIEKGVKASLVDADIGQCDLAPPGFIAMKIMDRKVLWLREVASDIMRFIGFLSPSQGIAISKLLSSILELVKLAEEKKSQVIIVNTDGWFGDFTAIQYKLQLIKNLKPDSIVLMGSESCNYLIDVLNKFSSSKTYCVPTPRIVRKRDRDDRRHLRKVNYMNYFQKAKRRCFKLSEVALLNSCLFNGAQDQQLQEKMQKELGVPILMLSRYNDATIIAVSDDIKIERIGLGHDNVYIVRPLNARGILVALLNSSFEEVGIGVIESLDFAEQKICILTEYEGEVRGLDIGRIIIGEDWIDRGIAGKCIL
jgi:polynucleotide 5'-hydroxyl-kinase GRC3/NOL9